MKYQSMLTAIGKAKLMAAQAKGEHVQLKEFAVGSGTEVISEAQQTLQKEEWRGAITNIAVDSKDKNILDVETVIPANEGGFFIKEFGVFDEAGDLIIVGNTPESYKPLLEAGAASSMRIISKTIISNAANVTLLVDENALYVTYKQMDDALTEIQSYTTNIIKPAANAYVDDNATIDSAEAGVTIVRPVSNVGNDTYLYYKKIIEDILNINYQLTDLSFFVVINKNADGRYVTYIRCYGFASGIFLYEIILYSNAKDKKYYEAKFPFLSGDGNPNGNVLAVKGAMYTDYTNSKLYIKKSTSLLVPTNTQWTEVGAVS